MDVITTHINADFDCLGAMVAARRLYPDALMVFPGAQERSVRDYLARNEQHAGLFTRLRDVDLDGIHRLILVDVRQAERIGPFAEVARRSDVDLHIYDHHPPGDNDLHGGCERIDIVGSTTTVLTQVFEERGIVPTSDEATMMMLGLYEDTGSLQFTSTTERDYQAAAFLLRHGASLNVVAQYLVQELTADQVELLNELLKTRVVLNINGIDVTIAHGAIPGYVRDIAALAQKIRDMENLDALILVVNMGDRIHLVGRSRRPEVPMGEILAEFGGGGHSQAASATVKDKTLVQVLDRLPQVLVKAVRPSWQARHLMTSPVKSVLVSAPVREVRELMTRYNINAAPVVDDDKLVGILTRQIVDKAAHHGFSNVAASEFMSRDYACVAPTTSVEELKSLIVERNQRFVPVVSEHCLVGAITRTDLLRHLVSGNRALPLTGPALDEGALFKKRKIERQLCEQLPETLTQLLRRMGDVADELDMGIYVVGGFVRDLLLAQPNFDVDVVVEGNGIAFADEFAKRYAGRVRAHEKFSTAVIILPDGFKIDVATTRMEYYLHPGALPTVEHASLKLDLYRRDFTVNTLAISLNSGRFGVLYDFFNGQGDLHKRIIRVLHNLSFVEDPTRVYRAVRFEQRLGFTISSQTESLLRSAVRMSVVTKVSGARLCNELTAILREAEPFSAIRRLGELDLLRYLHPQLKISEHTNKLFTVAAHALHWYELLYTGEKIERWQVYFFCLTDELSDEALQEMVKRLLFPVRIVNVIVPLRREARTLLEILRRRQKRATEPRPSELYRWFSPLTNEVLLYLTARADNDDIRRWLSRYFIQLRHIEPELTGNSLKKMGIPPGPVYRDILETIREARLDGKVTDKKDEIAFVKKRFCTS